MNPLKNTELIRKRKSTGWKKEIEEDNFISWYKQKGNGANFPEDYETLAVKKTQNWVQPNQVWAVSNNGKIRITFISKPAAIKWATAYMRKH